LYLSIGKYLELNPQLRTLPHDPESIDPRLPSHLEPDLGPNLMDQTILFRDQVSGKTTECTVQDYGTSRLRGDWFGVVFGDEDSEVQITEDEMKEILSSRV
jgi:hypothetical protein